MVVYLCLLRNSAAAAATITMIAIPMAMYVVVGVPTCGCGTALGDELDVVAGAVGFVGMEGWAPGCVTAMWVSLVELKYEPEPANVAVMV